MSPALALVAGTPAALDHLLLYWVGEDWLCEGLGPLADAEVVLGWPFVTPLVRPDLELIVDWGGFVRVYGYFNNRVMDYAIAQGALEIAGCLDSGLL